MADHSILHIAAAAAVVVGKSDNHIVGAEVKGQAHSVVVAESNSPHTHPEAAVDDP